MNCGQEILNIQQLAVFLTVPKSTVYKLVRGGRSPGLKVGRHWRFSREAILRWMAGAWPHIGEADHSARSKREYRAD
jgi:excisionase family DNA binding protein